MRVHFRKRGDLASEMIEAVCGQFVYRAQDQPLAPWPGQARHFFDLPSDIVDCKRCLAILRREEGFVARVAAGVARLC